MSSPAFTARDRLDLLEALLATATALRVIVSQMPDGAEKKDALDQVENLNAALNKMLERLREVMDG